MDKARTHVPYFILIEVFRIQAGDNIRMPRRLNDGVLNSYCQVRNSHVHMSLPVSYNVVFRKMTLHSEHVRISVIYKSITKEGWSHESDTNGR
jgi:hypothetical protein